MREQDRWTSTTADDVEAPGVVAVDPDRLVELRDERVVGIGIVAVSEAGCEQALAGIDDPADAGGDARGDPGALEHVADAHWVAFDVVAAR